MGEIELTQGFVACVDDVDFERFGYLNWHATNIYNGKAYAARRPKKPKRTFWLHRLILGAQDPETGEQLTNLVVDHINRDPLDNRRENLRLVTQRENQRNREPADCVYWNARMRKWQAVIYMTANSREEALEIARRMKEAGRCVSS